MSKVSYEILALEVEKMYQKQFTDDTPLSTVDAYIESIHTFIESCGWTTAEYLDRWLGLGQSN